MTIPTFEYRARDAADRGPMPKQFVTALADTGRFWRSTTGKILFVPDIKAPNEFISLGRHAELTTLLQEGDVLRIVGDEPAADEWQFFYHWVSDRRWVLPSAGARYQVRS